MASAGTRRCSWSLTPEALDAQGAAVYNGGQMMPEAQDSRAPSRPRTAHLPEVGMKQYQVVITKLQTKAREDEETLTDLLNERALAGWFYESSTALAANRLLLVFVRQA